MNGLNQLILTKKFTTMTEIMTDINLSIEIDNELLLEEVNDNSYNFEDED